MAFDSRLTDEDTLVLWDVFQSHEVRFRGVDGDSRADDVGAGLLVVLKESVDDLSTGLSEADHGKFHFATSLSIGRTTVEM